MHDQDTKPRFDPLGWIMEVTNTSNSVQQCDIWYFIPHVSVSPVLPFWVLWI